MRERRPGDTLQAVRGHAFAALLDRARRAGPDGHVDFEAVAAAQRREAGARARRW